MNYIYKIRQNITGEIMKDIMCSKIIVLDVNTSLEEIAKTMKKYDIGFIPISENNKIIGVITDRDIVVKILANKDNKLKGYLSKPISIDINSNINKVLDVMKKNKIKRVLVTENNKLIGIISLSDIISKNIDIKETIKEIYSIKKNDDDYETKVDDFIL